MKAFNKIRQATMMCAMAGALTMGGAMANDAHAQSVPQQQVAAKYEAPAVMVPGIQIGQMKSKSSCYSIQQVKENMSMLEKMEAKVKETLGAKERCRSGLR
jgi:hypothetical protein